MIAVIELTLTNYSAALRLDGFLKLICSPGPVAQAITFRAFGALLDALPHRPTPIEMLGRGPWGWATAPSVLSSAYCLLIYQVSFLQLLVKTFGIVGGVFVLARVAPHLVPEMNRAG